MKIFKLAIILAFAIVFVLTAVACNNNDKDTSSQSKQSDTSVNSDISSDSNTSSDSNADTDNNGSTDSTVEPWQSNANAEVIEKVEKLLESKHRLEYNEDGSFRVMIIADAHVSSDGKATDKQELKDRIKAIVDKINPNLVILTGDNTGTSGSERLLRNNITTIVGYLEEKEIPWCHVYGNHDHEYALPHDKQQEIYESFEYCISKDVETLSGTGNYVHGVYNKDGSLGSLIWLLDSGSYVDTTQYPGYYDFIKQDQIDWYKDTSLLIKEYNNGQHVNGMMAFHIPLIENVEAYNKVNDSTVVYEFTGGVNENMCPSAVDTNLLETIWELGNVKAIVTGHDHVNDYMFNYKGVKLTSSPNLSDLTYYIDSLQGSRIFDLDESKLDNIPTYVEYVIERLNPDDLENIESGTVLEDFENGFAAPVISGWDNEGLKANVSVLGATGKGAGATNGISVSADKSDSAGNFEFAIDFDTVGKVGSNNYIVVWMDFTGVEFRKACIGFTSKEGDELPYRTDDNDGTSPKFYYLADGATQWQTLSHGWDGCFGTGDGSSVINKKGYFAFKISDLAQGKIKPNENTIVSGFYFYGSLANDSYLDKQIYIDNIMLVEDYKTAQLPNE